MTVYNKGKKFPTGNFVFDDGGRSEHFPGDSKIGDCAIRACAIGAGKDYLETMTELFEIGLEIGDLPNSWPALETFLEKYGFKKNKPPRDKNGKKISIRNWAEICPEGSIIVRTRKHLTAIVDNKIRDTWLPEWCVNTWYSKKESN